MSTNTKDPWIVKIRRTRKDGVVEEKFWAGHGSVGTTARNARTFKTRAQARSLTKQAALDEAKNVVSTKAVRRSEILGDPNAPTYKQQTDLAISIIKILQDQGPTTTESKLSATIAEELLKIGYRKQ